MAAVIQAQDTQAAGAELLPMFLTQACVQVLGVAGAGLSITDELRVPLGASDPTATQAEMLQTTLGEGPCLDATAISDPVKVDEEQMATRWPMFHRELTAHTPYRGIASLPLRSSQMRRFGALDLYTTDKATLDRLPLNEINTEIADLMAAILFDGPDATSPYSTPGATWLTSHSVTNRMNVWTAIGILIEHTGLTNIDALATLRAYAHSHNADLDHIAHSITSRQLTPDALLASH